MGSATSTRDTLEDLYRVEGKAELIGGRIHTFMATGDLPGAVAFEIAVNLRAYARASKRGHVRGDNVGYAVPELPSGRESFSPDAAYYVGPRPSNRMRFVEGAPTFAVEVRSENDYGPAAEDQMAEKRADYFLAGTVVVWDVDPLAETVAAYRADAPTQAVIYRRGDAAKAEPAVPGWKMTVDEMFAD